MCWSRQQGTDSSCPSSLCEKNENIYSSLFGAIAKDLRMMSVRKKGKKILVPGVRSLISSYQRRCSGEDQLTSRPSGRRKTMGRIRREKDGKEGRIGRRGERQGRGGGERPMLLDCLFSLHFYLSP